MTQQPRGERADAQTLAANHRRFLRFLERRLGDRAQAEEVLQVAFGKALPKLGTVRDQESVVAWFFRVLRHAIVDHQRAASRARQRSAGHPVELDALAADATSERQVCACLGPIIATLRPEYAELLREIDLQQRSHEAAAAARGVTAGNLRVKLHRARQALKREVERTCRTCATHGCLDCTCAAAP